MRELWLRQRVDVFFSLLETWALGQGEPYLFLKWWFMPRYHYFGLNRTNHLCSCQGIIIFWFELYLPELELSSDCAKFLWSKIFRTLSRYLQKRSIQYSTGYFRETATCLTCRWWRTHHSRSKRRWVAWSPCRQSVSWSSPCASTHGLPHTWWGGGVVKTHGKSPHN